MKLFSAYKSLKYYEISEQVLLVLFATTLPVWWRLSLLILYLLLANLIVKIVATRHIGNSSLRKASLAAWVPVLAFVAMYAISLSYSEDLAQGYKSIERHLTFVAMALFFLLSNLSYMRRRHIHIMLNAMTLALILRFLVLLCVSAYSYLFVHHDIQLIIGSHFDPMHHSYLSLYILLSIAFLYSLLKKNNSRRKTTVLLLAIALLAVYIFLIQARMGLLLLLLFLIVALVHQIIAHQRLMVCLIVIVLLESVAVAMVHTAPLMTQRFVNLSTVISNSHDNDVRYSIMDASISIIRQSPVFGVGAGDINDALSVEYQRRNLVIDMFTPHNQYLETLICTGVFGLAFLLTMLLVPLIQGIRSKNTLMVAFIVLVAIGSLTESILERQMGILFFCFFLGLLPHLTTSSESGETY